MPVSAVPHAALTAADHAVARAMLAVTARAWAPVTCMAATVRAPAGTQGVRVQGVIEGTDVTPALWPYWPAYPGLAAQWR